MNTDNAEFEENNNKRSGYAGWMVIILVAAIVGVSAYFMFGTSSGVTQDKVAVDLKDVKQGVMIKSQAEQK